MAVLGWATMVVAAAAAAAVVVYERIYMCCIYENVIRETRGERL